MAIKNLIPWKRDEENKLALPRDTRDTYLSLRNEMERLFDGFLSSSFAPAQFDTRSFNPQMDVSENDKEIKVSVELPGMEEDDVQVSISHHGLTISGEKKAEKEDKGQNYYRLERSYGSFSRNIPLPEGINEDKIEAMFKKGVLHITLPKTAAYQAANKRIQVKRAS